jgi:hypothetical protein
VRPLQEGWAQVDSPSRAPQPAIIHQGLLCQQHASVGGVPLLPSWKPSRLLILAMHIRLVCSADLIHEDCGGPVLVS